MQSHDSNLQGYCAASLARLSEQEEGKELMRPYFKKLMEVLSIWALDTRKTGKELFNLPQLAAHVASNISNDNPEFKTRVPNVVTLVKSFMALTYSKDKRTQEHSLRLMNNVSDTSEDGKQSLVMGLVARLKRVKAEGSSASATAKILAKQTLSTHMGLHTAAITIQCICRGFLFRKMKEKAARAQEAAAQFAALERFDKIILTVRSADKICVIKGGSLAEAGTHAELIAKPDGEYSKLVQRQMSFVPGLYKIFDEILVNATDNKVRDPTMVTLRVDIDQEAGCIRVYNDGNGIPVEMHKEEGVYVPELIFGHLLTSSNYNDAEKKVTGGRNGYGAKVSLFVFPYERLD